jgi:hypothetical protein
MEDTAGQMQRGGCFLASQIVRASPMFKFTAFDNAQFPGRKGKWQSQFNIAC